MTVEIAVTIKIILSKQDFRTIVIDYCARCMMDLCVCVCALACAPAIAHLPRQGPSLKGEIFLFSIFHPFVFSNSDTVTENISLISLLDFSKTFCLHFF